MSTNPTVDLLHRLTHRVPGVPAHGDRHSTAARTAHASTNRADSTTAGTAAAGTARAESTPARHSHTPRAHHPHAHHQQARNQNQGLHQGRNHSDARPPRVLVAWQRRVAAIFGQDIS